jgi:hypothetical protein
MTVEILPPLTASVRVKPAGWRFGLRLWLPLFVLWLLLLPLLILALPFLFVAALIFGVNLLRTLGRVLALLAGFKGTEVDVQSAGTKVFVKLH